jgi:hypothetical protein
VYNKVSTVFSDGSVHDEPQQKEKDNKSRRELKEL